MVKSTNNLHTALLGPALAAALLCLGFPNELCASIVTGDSLSGTGAPVGFCVQELEAELDQLQADRQSEEGCCSAAEPADTEPDYPPFPIESDNESPRYANFTPNSGSAGSSTSSTSSVSSGNSVPFAVIANTPAIPTDDPLAERNVAERTLFLPDAPGLELLRPPQGE